MDLDMNSSNNMYNSQINNQTAGPLIDDLNELDELQLLDNINVWSKKQETLENEALKEFEILANETKQNSTISTLSTSDNPNQGVQSTKKETKSAFDIGELIKKQEEYQKRQCISLTKAKSAVQPTFKHSLIQPQPKRQKQKVKHKKSVRNKTALSVSTSTESTDNTQDIDIDYNVQTSPSTSREVLFRSTKQNIDYKAMNELKTEDGVFDESRLNEYNDAEINNSDEESEYMPTDDGDSEYCDINETDIKIPSNEKSPKTIRKNKQLVRHKVIDDSLIKNYTARLNLYYKKLEEENSFKNLNMDDVDDDAIYEKDHVLKGGLKVPKELWNKLYSFQQDGVEWLWELHQKSTGGLLGDEMGLGKTVQMIVFLHALQYSGVISKHCRFNGLGPSIIVCPTTVLHQWVKHFHEWSPELRIAVLHQSGSFQGNHADFIKDIHKNRGIIITSYYGIVKYKGNLLEHNWHYLILDEGHKIRNPTAKVSVAVKQLRTPHRIMLTGSPMQNNLTELWSLFDFTNPGMLGNLATFQEHFANPILQGGFSNASSMQEATALSVASTLKNVISPYLLRRSKNEVQHHILLPDKSEQVLFCSLTHEQKDLYKSYLLSEHVNMILGRGAKTWHSKNYIKANVLMAITALRKICNHPDLYLNEEQTAPTYFETTTVPGSEKASFYKRSGKMIVVSALLKIWKKQGHRVLLFSQGRGMIHVFQDFLEQQGYTYLKMDGSTSVTSRQGLIDTFNKDAKYDVFLLTTRVGGLGVNLTGANRVIIYDPDWNPATDTQARERSWRIGQEKQVTVYRLLSAGTIEEKMYQRQVWKQLLSNKILVDPATHRIFKSSDLYDLFSLEENVSDPETANIFRDSRVKIQEKLKDQKSKKQKKQPDKPTDSETPVQFTDDKIQSMKNLAQKIAQSLNRKPEENKEEEVKKTFYQVELEEERKLKLQQKQELKKLTAAEIFELNRQKALQKNVEESNKVDDTKVATFEEALNVAQETSNVYHKLNCGKVHVRLKRKSLESNKQEEEEEEIHVKKRRVSNETTEDSEERSQDSFEWNNRNRSKASLGECSTNKSEDSFGGSSRNRSEDSIIGNSKNSSSHDERSKKKHKKHKHKSKKHKVSVDTSGKIDGEEVEGLLKREIKKSKKDRKSDSGEYETNQNNFVLKHLFAKSGVSGALEHESIVGASKKKPSLRVRTEAEIKATKALEALKKSRLNNWRW